MVGDPDRRADARPDVDQELGRGTAAWRRSKNRERTGESLRRCAPPSTCGCRPTISNTRPRTRRKRSASTPRGTASLIVRTYADEGKSGLRLEGRDQLQRLIADVESGGADFQVVLVYDVSRWGRFQDADESAYYEYVCKRAGIAVHYCAEQFANDGSPVSTIVKGVKRAMAGEYSRELSAKVFAGQCRLIELGYRQGGIAGYGLRRMRVDQHGQTLGLLRPGEQKSLQTDRVILVPGPADEIATVDRIYRLFVEAGKTEAEIAEILNGAGTAPTWPALDPRHACIRCSPTRSTSATTSTIASRSS